MPRPRLHLDADVSSKALHAALLAQGHDVTRTPNGRPAPLSLAGIRVDASDRDQLMGATAQGRAILTFNVRDFVWLAKRHSHHGGIILASQRRWTMTGLIAALDRLLSETEATEWQGQVRWLSEWRTDDGEGAPGM